MTDIPIEGFVIVPPLSPRDVEHKAEIWAGLAYGSFGHTATEAWVRHARIEDEDAGERSQIIQRWHDRGYRVRRATMTLHDE